MKLLHNRVLYKNNLIMSKVIIMKTCQNKFNQFLAHIVEENLQLIVLRSISQYVVNQKHQRRYIILLNKDLLHFKVKKNNYLKRVIWQQLNQKIYISQLYMQLNKLGKMYRLIQIFLKRQKNKKKWKKNKVDLLQSNN